MKFSETKTEILETSNNVKLLTHIWLPEKKIKAVFIALHGGMTHGGDWITAALFFKKKGIATYALDLRWHGTYPQYNKNGKVLFHIDSYDEYSMDVHNLYHRVKEIHPNLPIYIIGHSNGSLIALRYGLTLGINDDIKGYILSSPWLKNIVAIPPIMQFLAKIISKFAPMLAIKAPSLNDVVTRDKDITARHYNDEKIGIRGTEGSAKLVVEATKTQKWVIDNLQNWTFPIFAVLAGQDKLADPEVSEKALKKIKKELLTFYKYEDNFHENFNELNRTEIYELIVSWMGDKAKTADCCEKEMAAV